MGALHGCDPVFFHISHISFAISQCPKAKASESSLDALGIPSDTGLGSEWSPGLGPTTAEEQRRKAVFLTPMEFTVRGVFIVPHLSIHCLHRRNIMQVVAFAKR